MTGVKLASVVGIASWTTGMSAATMQVVIGEDTLVPLGLALACIGVLITVAVRVTRWVDAVQTRLRKLEEEIIKEQERE